MSDFAAHLCFWLILTTVTATLWWRSSTPQVSAAPDWAMLEALDEVDAIGWAAPPVAPPKRDPLNTGLAMLQGQAWEIHCGMAEMRNAVLYANTPGLRDAVLMANQAGRESIEAALWLRGR